MPMGRTDYENVARILKGLPTKESVRVNAVVSACQVFRARPTFDTKRFAREAGVFPCTNESCNFICQDESVLELHFALNHQHNTEEVNQ